MNHPKTVKSWQIIITVLTLLPSLGLAQTLARVDTDLRSYDFSVAEKNATFNKIPVDINDKSWVKLKLTHMVDVDQFMRTYSNALYEKHYSDGEIKYFWKHFAPIANQVDAQNTADLKALLKIYNWFTISSFGVQPDQNAWLLVQHADLDLPFQRHVLTILEKLYSIGDTSPSNYAYLFDRVASSFNDPSQRTLQRYGTQGSCTGTGTWAPLPVEDPSNLDERRKLVGLGSEAEYFKMFKDLCH